MLCVAFSTLHSQTNKDLNSPERVKAMYQIVLQHQELTKQVKACKDQYNSDMAGYEEKFKQIQSLAVALGEESSAFVSHNLDLQAGLLNSLERQEKLEIKNAKLEAKRNRKWGIGAYGGCDLITQRPSVGISLNYNIYSF